MEIEEGRRGVEIGVGNESSHKVSLVNAGTENVGIRLSDMYCLHIRVRQSRSLDLGSSLLLSKLDLLHLVFPLMLPPNLSTGYVILFSLVFLLSSKLVLYYLSYCGYMLLFRCINSRPSWPSEIKTKFLRISRIHMFPVYGLTIEPFFNREYQSTTTISNKEGEKKSGLSARLPLLHLSRCEG